MKKYLMSGIAAIAVCAAFTSCSKENLYDENAVVEKNEMAVREAYAQAFEKAFGKVGANVDWGFGPSRSNTRATGEFANHVGAYPDANMWTSKGFLAPDPLTPGQKLRVQFYFQMVQNPGGTPDKGTLDFFMQQVYDGGTDPMDGKSPEKYLAANNSTYIESGEHMDHLTVGPNNLHTFNFNNGNCSTNGNVANRTQTNVNNTSEQHSDQIQLMLNTPTSCFGYANSDASYVRTDRWRLVSGEVIDAFCDDPSNGYAAFLAAHQGVEDKKCYWDDFKRSYIGFDFDMLPDEHIISGEYEWDNSVTPAKCKGVKHYNYFNIYIGNADKIWNGTELVDVTSVGEVGELYGNRVLYPYMPGTTNKVKMVSANTNQFCGSTETWNDDKWKYTVSNNGQNIEYKRIDYMYTALREGKLPTTSSDKTWVTIGNCADGYYSDWIVSFLPAEPEDTPVTTIYRVIAEDLTADEASDFDFNDVVFDVEPNEAGTAAKIVLRAAGGIYKLTVRGQEVHEAFAAAYPDAGYGLGENGLYPMINTNPWNPEVKVTLFESLSGDFSPANIRTTINSIEIKVYKPGYEQNGLLLTARTGEAACKILVDNTFEVVRERTGIADKNTNFHKYVQGYWDRETEGFWWQRNLNAQ